MLARTGSLAFICGSFRFCAALKAYRVTAPCPRSTGLCVHRLVFSTGGFALPAHDALSFGDAGNRPLSRAPKAAQADPQAHSAMPISYAHRLQSDISPGASRNLRAARLRAKAHISRLTWPSGPEMYTARSIRGCRAGCGRD